ncbi:MAG TPA: lipid-binding SYLF domain-containing protein [Pyrinomonadaceae bacterium]|nr:lipid-binding SYLF domain-containing protein [Pyrinomonadaceae bacterium]
MSLRTILVILMVSVFTVAVTAQNNTKALREASERVDKASVVMNEIMGTIDKSIPRDLLKKAEAVVVFPGAIKAAFIFGGQGGKGIAIRRTRGGWSAPAFLNMAGGSVGFQIGGSKTDYILLIMNAKGMNSLLKDKFEMGGEGSVAAGPVGRTAAASTNATAKAEILTYSRAKGLFAGVSLKGVVISPDKDMNASIYRKSADQILGTPPVTASAAPVSLQKFSSLVAALSR